MFIPFILFFTVFMRLVSGDVPASQLSGLYYLYNATNGDDWNWGDSVQWIFSPPGNPCNASAPWYGVVCSCITDIDCIIIGLDIGRVGLNGSIPFEITTMSQLQSIVITGNRLLGGTIPHDIGVLTQLTALELYGNHIEGTIPSSVGALELLQSFSLNDNYQMIGDIPSSLCMATALSSIDLGACEFRGSLPSCMGSLTNLESLVANNNALTGVLPSGFGLLSNLRNIDISQNLRIRGPLPSGLCAFSSLSVLSIHLNRFSGTIPTCLVQLNQLETVRLDANVFSGPWPALASPVLGVLRGDDCQFTGQIPSSVCSLSSLSYLEFSVNTLTGSIPACFGSLHRLTLLDLAFNQLSQSLPSELFDIQELSLLFLHFNKFHGSIPSQVANLTNLEFLSVDNNKLSGSLPTGWPLSLAELYLQVNTLTGPIPQQFGELTNLLGLALYSNLLSMSIPASLGSLVKLGYLDCSINSLTGSIPTTFVNLSSLNYLYLRENQLVGGDFLQSLNTHVSNIDVSQNLFSGSFPFSTTGFEIVELYFRQNLYDGSIPSDVSLLLHVQNMDMSENSLTGTLPLALHQATDLVVLLVSTNNFHGTLSALFSNSSFGNQLKTVDVSSNGFSGSIPVHLFNSLRLTEFSGGLNCFTGSIPSEVCNALRLKTLNLAGLTAGRTCITPYEDGLFNFYTSQNVRGVIPECLFQHEELENLSLSGNGIEGRLHEINSNTSLRNLTLSHNRLEGTIPVSFQQYPGFISLDLSFNRLTGVIENFGHTYTGRGHLDTTAMSNMSVILESNRLSGGIPKTFQHAEHINILDGNMFQCDAENPVPLHDPVSKTYVCGSNRLKAVLYGCAVFVGLQVLAWTYRAQYSHAGALRHFALLAWNLMLWRENSDLGNSTLNRLCHMLARFRSYLVSVVVLALFIMLPVYLTFKFLDYSSHTYQYGWLVSLGFMSDMVPATTVFVLWMVLLPSMIVFDVYMGREFRELTSRSEDRIIQRTSNTAYKYEKVLGLVVVNGVVVFGVNVAYVLAVLTQGPAVQAVVVMLTSLFKTVWNLGLINPTMISLECTHTFMFLVSVFNNLLAPILGTLFVDINCFRTLFVPPAALTELLVLLHYRCYFSVDPNGSVHCVTVPYAVTESFVPPFMYSGQCSSSLLANYVPVYVIMFGIVRAALIVMQFAFLIYFYSTPDENIDPAKMSAGDRQKSALLARIKANMGFYRVATLGTINTRVLPLMRSDDLNKYTNPTTVTTLYKLKEFGIVIIVGLVVLLTYGIAYPPLGFIIFVDVVLTTVLMECCVAAHFARIQRDSARSELWDKLLMYELVELSKTLSEPKPFAFILAAIFVCIFIMDMGMASDYGQVLTYVVTLSSWALVLALLYHFFEKQFSEAAAAHMRKAVRRTSRLMSRARTTLQGMDLEMISRSGVNKQWPTRLSYQTDGGGDASDGGARSPSPADETADVGGVVVENPLRAASPALDK